MNIVSASRPSTPLANVPPRMVFGHQGKFLVRLGSGSSHVGGDVAEFRCFDLVECKEVTLLGTAAVEIFPNAKLTLE